MRQKLRQIAGRPSAGSTGEGRRPGERRGDLPGAQLGPGPGRPGRAAVECVQVRPRRLGQPRPAGRHRRVPGGGLVHYTGLAEQTVRTCLDRLAAEGIISPCDPDIVAARSSAPTAAPGLGSEPQPGLRRPGRRRCCRHGAQFPGLGSRLAAATQPGTDGPVLALGGFPRVVDGGDRVGVGSAVWCCRVRSGPRARRGRAARPGRRQ
jgi:hypothetical protein